MGGDPAAGEPARELTEDDLPKAYRVEPSKLTGDNSFGEAAFELLKEVSLTLAWLTGRVPESPLDRDRAIRRGLLKRLALLGKSLLSDISGNSGYQQLQIVRQVIEVAANYVYLAEDSDGERHDAYVKHSLAEEKVNLRLVATQIKKRGGNALPIEERMQRSMNRMASVAGIDLEDVPRKADCGWPGTEERLAAVSPTAYPAYRGGSSALHGGWSALLLQDIAEEEGGFSLDNGLDPQVQPMTAAGIVISETAIYFLERDGDDTERSWFLERLEDVAKRIRQVDELHEEFMHAAS